MLERKEYGNKSRMNQTVLLQGDSMFHLDVILWMNMCEPLAVLVQRA